MVNCCDRRRYNCYEAREIDYDFAIVIRRSGSPIVYLAVNASESFPVGLPRPVTRLRLANLLCKSSGKESIRSDSSNWKRQLHDVLWRRAGLFQ